MSAQSIKDKAREISYALVRVAWYVKRPDLRSRFDALAIELLENSARAGSNNSLENLNQALSTVSVLDGLVRLGHSIYEIEPVNATILVTELDNLNKAIRQYGNLPNEGEKLPDIGNLFSKSDPVQVETKVQPVEVVENNPLSNQDSGADFINVEQQPSVVDLNELDGDLDGNKNMADGEIQNYDNSKNKSSNGNGFNTAIRQSAIINRIKSGNGNGCRLKDLLAEFPDVSERTLRYDLQRLCEQGIIERMGNGGPSSYYVLKEGGLSQYSGSSFASVAG